MARTVGMLDIACEEGRSSAAIPAPLTSVNSVRLPRGLMMTRLVKAAWLMLSRRGRNFGGVFGGGRSFLSSMTKLERPRAPRCVPRAARH